MKIKSKSTLLTTTKAKSSELDYSVFGTELTKLDGTMDDLYNDGSDHLVCPKCGYCIECGDCEKFGCGRAK